jgi:hypothetical protein
MLAALLSAVIVAAAVVFGAAQLVRELAASREQAARSRALDVMALFAPGIAAASSDPRALLAWQPLARAARAVAPDAFATLDAAAGSTFPFSKDYLEAAHAKWTADWLAWELSHDGEFKMKTAAAEADVVASGGSALAKARLDAVLREKLDLYQRHYSDYVRVAKALQALIH